jgi:ParB/RepB/Spo0J family partition protein
MTQATMKTEPSATSNALTVLPAPTLPAAAADVPLIADELVLEGGKFGHYNLGHIRISRTNRKRFNETKLHELAASIKAKGVAQPILIRPVTPTEAEPQQFEIVAGERRFRASIIAGLTSIPAMCRELSDLEALELQILENLQRDDPHPLEEAEGYERLMLTYGYNADQLAEKVNKSRSYVYGRLKLCALSLDVRELFLDDKISASTALLIARIPVPELQKKATQEILKPQYGNEPMSYRQAAAWIDTRYTLELDDAPFDTKDGKLLASAGNCVKCPKRTGNQPVVFADAKSANTCTDPDCFAEKKAAHYQRIIVAANKKGIPVLEGDEERELVRDTWSREGEFVIATNHLSSFQRVAPRTGMSGQIREHLPEDAMPAPARFVKNSSGVVTPVYRRTDIQAALEKVGACETEDAQATRLAEEEADPSKAAPLTAHQKAEIEHRKERDEKAARAKTITRQRTTLYRKVRARAAGGLPLDTLRALAKAMILDSDQPFSVPDDLLGDLYSFGRSDVEACAYIDQADAPTVQLLIMDMLVSESLSVSTWCVDDDPAETYIHIERMATDAGITVTPADLAIAGIDIKSLNGPDDVREMISENVEHLAEVCQHIVAKAPHHVGNVQAAANALGYVYAVDGWKKEEPVDTPEPIALQTERPKLQLKTKPASTDKPVDGPIVKVKKHRTVELTPAAAWPFPTQTR